jgi:hypothetical protein
VSVTRPSVVSTLKGLGYSPKPTQGSLLLYCPTFGRGRSDGGPRAVQSWPGAIQFAAVGAGAFSLLGWVAGWEPGSDQALGWELPPGG